MAPAPSHPARTDVHSFGNPSQVAVDHLSLDLVVDFEQHVLSGRASLRLDHRAPTDELVLDTRDLVIEGVSRGDGTALTFQVGAAEDHLGAPLRVAIDSSVTTVHVDYRTSPSAAALLWLEPAQTAGGEHPFLFSQSQAALARTWVPCQDSPGVRMTYDAQIAVPPALIAVMSAVNPTARSADGVYRFEMSQPIPSYLLALAVGDLDFRPLGERSGVYAEPQRIDAAAHEFAEVEEMIRVTESLYGPYRWERYDILVLPPSFPFGGMENPRLTFATPTIIAGDRSLVSLIAHELAHSWSGNLVTNSTWNDFWLNEGFTTYIERRIMEALYGREYAEMLASLGLQDLHDRIDELGATSPDTHLVLDLAGRDPDDGMTDIAYEKGASLLRLLEERVGREAWDRFIRAYFEAHAFQSIDTPGFLAYLDEHLLADHPAVSDEIDLQRWLHGPALPADAPQPAASAFAEVEAEIARWAAGTSAAELRVDGWTTHHWLHLLRNLPAAEAADRLGELDLAFELTSSGNSEILCEWLRLAVTHRYEAAYPTLEEFLTTVGRRKFLKPLYEDLVASGQIELARAIYTGARPGYHAVSASTIDGIVGGSP